MAKTINSNEYKIWTKVCVAVEKQLVNVQLILTTLTSTIIIHQHVLFY